VGDNNTGFLRLYHPDKPEEAEYIALSHCWGKLPQVLKDEFCTVSANVDKRKREGISMDVLPQTFKDAVTVTRELGKRYLWVDSLCIIQDDPNDWAIESKRMEAVFTNAYCTIAADSAADSTVGFLKERQLPHYVEVPDSAHGRIYICEAIDDFHRDVEEGVLAQRAWVLQERALSRRTIHFTTNQLYWECGNGVRCETLAHMRNSKSLFLSDPKFPKTLRDRSESSKIDLFQTLFANYSRLGITKSADRTIAISGLEKRLAFTFRTQGRHGVFKNYLHRSLLWERSEDTRMKRILYPTDRRVPSWSWMAYEGVIDYVDIPFNRVEWHKAVQIRGDVLEARVREFRSLQLEQKDGKCVIQDGTASSGKWWLKYDGEDSVDLQTLQVAVIGRENGQSGDGRRYYILVVKPRCLEGFRTFERVAVGCVPEKLISFKSQEVCGKIF